MTTARTEQERRAELAAQGHAPEWVAEIIASETVNGAWCDGAIVLDASGKRCVTREQRERVARTRAEAPLPAPIEPERSPMIGACVVALVALVVVVVVLAATERG